MLKKLFRTMIDICRPGVDDASCAWGEPSQNRSKKAAVPQNPHRRSKSEVTDPTQPPPMNPVS